MLRVALIILSLATIFSSEQYGIFFEIEENSFLSNEDVIWNGEVYSLLRCSQMCAREAVCKSANFITKGGKCLLHKESRKIHPDRLLKQQGSFYVEKVSMYM